MCGVNVLCPWKGELAFRQSQLGPLERSLAVDLGDWKAAAPVH
jgi:hypothetical protein